MGDNNEQEAADLDAMSDDDVGANLFEVRYRGGRLDNDYNNRWLRPLGVPHYHIPANIPFRLLIDVSITKIDDYACYCCRTLTEVVFHNNVTDIGRRAFGGCPNLQPVELPAGLLRLEEGAFSSCTTLQRIVIPANVEFIGDYVFCWCRSLVRVVFAPRTTSIEFGRCMFLECTDLRFVTLPHNLRSIPARFFFGCTSLTHLQIPPSVEEIGELAFMVSGIQAMNSSMGDDFMPGTIILPPNLQSIPRLCFMYCRSLTHIRIPPSVQQIGEEALKRSDLRSIVIPETVREIGREACSDCALLERVIFHSTSNLRFANNIFANCPMLSTIMMAPWLWPKLFVSMNGHPEFIFRFFRHYHTQIRDFNNGWVNRNPGGGGSFGGDGEDDKSHEADASEELSTVNGDNDNDNCDENHHDQQQQVVDDGDDNDNDYTLSSLHSCITM